jgi:hypothetical protein
MGQERRAALPVDCPKCGERGWVPLNRLDRQLACKQCRTKFYLDSTGKQFLIGKRPAKLLNPLEFIYDPRRWRPDFAEKAFLWWARRSRGTRMAVKGIFWATVLALLLAPLGRYYLRPRPKFPPTLNERAVYVVSAFARNDRDRLEAISVPATRGDLNNWLAKARPAHWPKSIPSVQAKVMVVRQTPKRAVVRAEIERPLPTPPPPPPPEAEAGEEEMPADQEKAAPESSGEPEQSGQDKPEPTEEGEGMPPPEKPKEAEKLTLMLYWLRDVEAGWMLDLAETLKNLR